MFGNYKPHPAKWFRDFASAARPVGAAPNPQNHGTGVYVRLVVAKHRPTGVNPVVAFTV